MFDKHNFPTLSKNEQHNWNEEVLRLLKGKTQKSILNSIYQTVEKDQTRKFTDFCRAYKSQLSQFIKGKPPTLRRWFCGAAPSEPTRSKRGEPEQSWLSLFCEATGVRPERLSQTLESVSAGGISKDPDNWNSAFTTVRLRDAWIDPPVTWKNEPTPSKQGNSQRLNTAIPKLRNLIPALKQDDDTSKQLVAIEKVIIVGPKASGARSLARHLAEKLWRYKAPSENDDKKNQGQFSIVVLEEETGRELALFGEGAPSLTVCVRDISQQQKNARSSYSENYREAILKVEPWTTIQLLELAQRLVTVQSISENCRKGLQTLIGDAPKSLDQRDSSFPIEPVGYANEAIELLAALIDPPGNASWDRSHYAEARARRDWQQARRQPGAEALSGIHQKVIENILSQLLSCPRDHENKWSDSITKEILSNSLRSAPSDNRPGLNDLVSDLRRAKSIPQERILAKNLADRLRELDADIILNSLCRAKLLRSQQGGYTLRNSSVALRLAARGFSAAQRSPWSPENAATLLTEEAPQLARELTWAGIKPITVLKQLSRMPASLSGEAARIAVALVSSFEKPLSNQASKHFHPLWFTSLADACQLLFSVFQYNVETERLLYELSQISRTQDHRLPRLSLEQLSSSKSSFRTQEMVANSYIPSRKSKLDAHEKIATTALVCAPFQSTQILLNQTPNSAVLRQCRETLSWLKSATRATFLWEILDRSAREDDFAARDALLTNHLEIMIPAAKKLEHLRLSIDSDKNCDAKFVLAVQETLNSEWKFFPGNQELLSEMQQALESVQPWVRDAILGTALGFPINPPPMADTHIVDALNKLLESPTFEILEALELAKNCDAIGFLEKVAKLPVDLLPQLEIDLCLGLPVLTLPKGIIRLPQSGPWFSTVNLKHATDPVSKAWTLLMDLACRAASKLVELGDYEEAYSLCLANEIDEEFFNLRHEARWSEFIGDLLSCGDDLHCPIELWLKGAKSHSAPCDQSLLLSIEASKLTTMFPDDSALDDRSDRERLLSSPANHSWMIPSWVKNGGPPMLTVKQFLTQRASEQFHNGEVSNPYRFLLLLAHIDPKITKELEIDKSLLPQLTSKQRGVLLTEILPKVAQFFGRAPQQPSRKLKEYLNSHADKKMRERIHGFDSDIEVQTLFRNQCKDRLKTVVKSQLTLAQSLLKSGDDEASTKVLAWLWYGSSRPGYLPRKLPAGSSQFKTHRDSEHVELLQKALNNDEFLDIFWSLADTSDRRAQLVPFAFSENLKSSRHYKARRPWAFKALSCASEDIQRLYLANMRVTKNSAKRVCDLLSAPVTTSQPGLALQLSRFDPGNKVLHSAINSWAFSKAPLKLDRLAYKAPEQWLETLSNVANHSSSLRWLKGALEQLWASHVELGEGLRTSHALLDESKYIRREELLLKILSLKKSWLKNALIVARYPFKISETTNPDPMATADRTQHWAEIASNAVVTGLLDNDQKPNRLALIYESLNHVEADLVSAWARTRASKTLAQKKRSETIKLSPSDRLALAHLIHHEPEFFLELANGLPNSLLKNLIPELRSVLARARPNIQLREIAFRFLPGVPYLLGQ